MPASTNQRLDNLEVKATFTEDTLERLNDVVVRQQGHIEALTREVAQLRRLLAAADTSATPAQREDLPPHY